MHLCFQSWTGGGRQIPRAAWPAGLIYLAKYQVTEYQVIEGLCFKAPMNVHEVVFCPCEHAMLICIHVNLYTHMNTGTHATKTKVTYLIMPPYWYTLGTSCLCGLEVILRLPGITQVLPAEELAIVPR